MSTAPTERLRSALTQRSLPPRVAPAMTRPIRIEPRDATAVIGILPPDAAAAVLQNRDAGWQLVNYQGVVGWVMAGAPDAQDAPR